MKSAKDFNQKKEDCKTCGWSHSGDCWHLKAECFHCHEIGHISTNCPGNRENKGSTSTGVLKPRENSNSKGKAKKINCLSQKISTEQPRQALASSSNILHQRRLPPTSVIIDSGATDHFFANKDLITNYREHQHLFETGSGEKVTAQGYGEVILQLQLLDGTVNSLTVSNVS